MALALCFSLLPTAALAEEAGAAPDAANANSSGEAQDGEADTAVSAVQEAHHANHCVCGGNGNVNGHKHDTAGTEWTEWTKTDSLPDSAGSYYLTQPVTADWTVPTGEVNLCLNGQTISGSITVGSDASLTLTDCSSDNSGKIQGEVTVNGGKFELYSGTITGGVEVGRHSSPATGSAFTMYGGTISGNTDTGGVFLVGTTNDTDPPRFTMHGGTISNNTAGASDGGGGGVYVGQKCSFTMDGGTITGNTATDGNGGGIYIHFNAGIVSISNATITGNKASATGNTSYGHGGGIYSQRGVTVKNVTITGNNSTYEGGGIYGKGAIALTDATVTDNNHYDVYYDGAEKTTPELTVSGSVKAGYYANYNWKLPILVSGTLSADSVIRVGVYDGIKPAYGSQLAIAEPASGVTLSAKNFKADAADCVTSLGDDGNVYLVPCTHEMDDTGYTCKKCHTQFDARVGDSAYYQTLTKAFDAARGSTVTLLRNVTLTGNCSSENYSATLDLNGKTVSSGDYRIGVGGGNKPNTLTVKDSGTGGGTQALTVKFLVYSNGTLAVDDSYTGEISRVELQAGGALECFGGKIGELVLSNAAYGSTSTGYGLKLWNGNTNACTIGKITDNTKSKSLTVNDLLGTDYAKCELYGEKDGAWSIIDKSTKIVDLTGYTAYKVQFQECVHQCANDTVEKPVCSKCGKALVVKITATASDGKIKTAWFPVDSAIENGDGYVEAIQTLNGWSAEGYTDATLMPLCDVHNNSGGIGIASVTLTGKLTVDGGKHLIYSTTIASDADVTFKTGRFYYITVNGKASFVGGTYLGGVTASSGAEAVFSGGAYQYLTVKDGGTAVVKNSAAFDEDVTVTKGTLTVEGGSFKAAVVVEGDGTMNVNGGSFTGTGKLDRVKYSGGAKGTISGGSFADLYLYSSGTAWLAGGSFTKLSTASTGALSSLLADGAAYYDQSGNAISNSGVSELNNVTVKTHAHTVDVQTGICSVCGKKMAASLTVGNETSWYLTLDAAIKAANEGNGEKMLKLYQDVTTGVPSYELTRGPVTLDVNGKKASGVIITVKGIQLTVTGTGTIRDVTASGSSAVVKNSTVNINYITAENGGRLELGGGSYMGLTVNNDGSSASLSGGTYKKIEWGKSYVPANEYLADGYGYKTSEGKWGDGTASVDNVTVTPAPIKSTKVYPNSEMNYSGSTFDAKDSTSVTLTVSVTPEESAGLTYIWCRSINDDWRWLTNSSITQNLTEKYTGANSQKLSITGLPAGQTFSYKVQIETSDGYKCFSKPFTVTRHQHSWTYTASGATITAKCTAEDCYLTDKLGGTFTISAPAANTLTYDGNAKEAAAKLDAVSGVTSLPTVGDITYMQNGKTLPSAPVNAGTYTASITVGEGNKAATASVTYTIGKATPKAEGFTFSAPTSLTYDGNVKSATVSPAKAGTGDVIVKYYDKDGKEATPKNAGEYTVKIDVAESTNYAAANGLTADGWKFSITKAAPTLPTGLTGVTGKKLSTVGLPAGWSWTNGDTMLDAAGNYTFEASYTGDGNHNGTTTNLTVTVSNKSVDKNTLSLTQPSMTYGQGELPAYELTHKPATVSENRVHYTGTLRDNSSYDSDAKPTQAGSYTVTVMCETADTIYTASANFTIYPIDLGDGSHGVGFSSPEITYTGNAETASVHPLGPNGSPQMKLNTDYEISGTISATNVGKYTATIQGIGNNYTGEVSGTWQITPAPLTITGATVTAKTYDGSTSAQVTGVTFTGLKNNEQLELGTDYAVTAAAFNNANVNAANKVTGTVALKNTENAKNYTLSSATFEQEATIGKADFTGTISKTIPIVKNRTAPQTGSLTAADFFPANQVPDGAAITYVTPGSGTLMITVALNGGQFSYDSKCNLSDAADETYTVTIATTNYTDIKATLTFHLTDKETVTISGLTYTDKTYDGQPIAPTGALVVSGDKVPVGELEVLYTGTGSTVYQSADAPKNAGTYQVTYKVAESNESCIGSVAYSFTIAPKQVTVAPKSISMTKGDALPAFELAYDGLVQGESLTPSAQPIFTCFESDGTTAVTANTAAGTYAITWTNADGTTFSDANYIVTKEAAGTLTITARPSSGGGGSSSPNYPVTTPGKTENGTVTVSPRSAEKGDTVTITAKPDSGYQLDDLTVTDKNGKELKLTDKGNGKYTFTMPAGKVEINAAFVKEVETSPFSDVSTSAYYYEAVKWAQEKGITGGIGNGLFGPNQPCTRAQIVTFLWRAAGSPVVNYAMNMTDVAEDAYYGEAVRWALSEGITTGTGDGKFSPDATCNRAQSVTFLFRAIGKIVDSKAEFGDVLTDSYYANAVAWAVENGITNGIGDGLFGPDNSCTRAQIVTFLFRAYQGK